MLQSSLTWQNEVSQTQEEVGVMSSLIDEAEQ